MVSLSRITRMTLVAATAAVAGALLGGPQAEPPCSTTWAGGDARGPIEPAALLPTEFPLRLELGLDEPMHVYVASHDLVRGTIALFPSTALRSDLGANPLPAGNHSLPGRHMGKELAWHGGDGVGGTTFIVIASREPLTDLASALHTCRQMGNAAFPHLPTLGTYAPIGGMEGTPPTVRPAHPLLEEAAAAAVHGHDGPMAGIEGREGVFASALRVVTEGPMPTADLEQAVEKIRAQLGTALPFEAAPAPAGK
jgi:hypothetical protein